MAKFVSKVTSEKPRARVYIDDKGIRFTDWTDALESMETLGIIEKESFINISNIAFFNSSTKKRDKLQINLDEKKGKIRVLKSTNKEVK